MIRVEERDLNLSGTGQIAGGAYRFVKLEGISKVNGPMACEQMTVNGVATMNGSVAADRFELAGKLTVHGDLLIQAAKAEGQITIDGDFRGEAVSLNGMVKVKGNCELHEAALAGGFTILGSLLASRVDLKLSGRCQAKSIQAGMIEIRQLQESNWSKGLRFLIPALDPRAWVGQLIGEHILIEATQAQLVRGDRISIGKGCVIDRVEYRASLFIDPEAKVRERVKI